MKLKWRLIFMTFFLLVLYAALGVRLFTVQITCHDRFSAMAQNNYFIQVNKISPLRGEIYDRNGKILAVNKHTYSIGFNPNYGKITRDMVKDISGALGKSSDAVDRQLKSASGFIWVARHVDPYRTRKLLDYRKNGMVIIKENSRYYPSSPLASQVIGCVGTDNQGLSGIEYNFDQVLKGPSCEQKMVRDARGKIIHLSLDEQKKRDLPGKIFLTIDANLQYIVERELIKGFEDFKPSWAMALVQNPVSGEILAMAAYPGFNNNCGAPASVEELKNKAVSSIFEPGSTFKIVTAAAALEEEIVETDEIIDCERGKYEIGGFPIRDYEPHDRLSFTDCMVYSSNIALAKIGDRLGSKLLYKYARDFGFGNFTGIRLPGESRGILRKPDRWSGTSLSRIAFGQEIGVTAVQLIGAFSVIANGGILCEPRIVKSIEVDGKIREFDPLPIRRVVSEKVAGKLTRMLKEVVERGSGEKAKIEGYTVAGKTGTAQKFNPETSTYAKDKYVALFGGFVPADNPELSILVVFDEPHESLHWGGYVAAPVFRAIARASMSYLNIPPDKSSACN